MGNSLKGLMQAMISEAHQKYKLFEKLCQKNDCEMKLQEMQDYITHFNVALSNSNDNSNLYE